MPERFAKKFDRDGAGVGLHVGAVDLSEAAAADQLAEHKLVVVHSRQCVPECPTEAIFYEDDVPDQWKAFIDLNSKKLAECQWAHE
ncbi:MAG: hypothetical protein Rhob2KO_09340 [Rhodopirellula baltica]